MGDNESHWSDDGRKKKSQSSRLISNDGRFRSIDHAAHVFKSHNQIGLRLKLIFLSLYRPIEADELAGVFCCRRSIFLISTTLVIFFLSIYKKSSEKEIQMRRRER